MFSLRTITSTTRTLFPFLITRSGLSRPPPTLSVVSIKSSLSRLCFSVMLDFTSSCLFILRALVYRQSPNMCPRVSGWARYLLQATSTFLSTRANINRFGFYPSRWSYRGHSDIRGRRPLGVVLPSRPHQVKQRHKQKAEQVSFMTRLH